MLGNVLGTGKMRQRGKEAGTGCLIEQLCLETLGDSIEQALQCNSPEEQRELGIQSPNRYHSGLRTNYGHDSLAFSACPVGRQKGFPDGSECRELQAFTASSLAVWK